VSVDVPILVAPYLDAWARTSPAPDPDQPVEPFLHGLDRGAPEVSICWRATLPSVEAWESELEVLPIRDEERVEVPLWAARRFLEGIEPGALADLEAVIEPAEGKTLAPRSTAYVQRVDGSVERLTDPMDLRPGDTVILDPSAGGHDAWGWTGAPGPVPDVADLVPRARPAIRLRPAILAWASGEDPSVFRSRLMQTRETPLQERAHAVLAEAIALARARGDADPWLSRWIEHAERMSQVLAQGGARVTAPGAGDGQIEPELGLLVEVRGQVAGDQAGDEGEATSSTAPAPIPLARHAADVGQRARGIAEALGLPPDLVRAIELAGYLHDMGKAERRFQLMLHRGDPDRLEASGLVLAKSGMDPADRAAFRRARELAGLPPGWRHEAVSSALAAEVLRGRSDVDVALVQHLVAAHHGCARPLFPPVEGLVRVALLPLGDLSAGPLGSLSDVGEVEVDHVDWSGPRRLASLCRRYGWWGLALLEAVVRLADIAVSEEYG
jgi:CRISPR-associated endonuclease/helicase Cas3